MKIPRDLYCMLNKQDFSAPPWRRDSSVIETLSRLLEGDLSYELTVEMIEELGLVRPGTKYRVGAAKHGRSIIRFGGSIGSGERWDIEFRTFALHTGDEQPLRTCQAQDLLSEDQPLEWMRVPIGLIELKFGSGFYRITNVDFESVVGDWVKPGYFNWRRGSDIIEVPLTRRAQKAEFLHECAARIQIVDSGWKSAEEAASAISRVLNVQLVPSNNEDIEHLWRVPLGRTLRTRPTEPNSSRPNIPRSFIQFSPNYNEALHDRWTIKFRALAAHTGDWQPIPIREAKDLQEKGETELMEVPMGYIDSPYKSRSWRKAKSENVDFKSVIGRMKCPVELTWSEDSDEAQEEKINFLREGVKMIYILDSGERGKEEAASALEKLAGIRLRHSTDSKGRDYWWRPVPDASSTKSSSRSSGFSKPPSRPGKDRSDPRVPSQTVVDLYGGDEEQAHAHWCNTH